MTDAELLQAWLTRQDGGLTQAQAAHWLGMSQPGVHAVLMGKNRLSGTGRRFIEYLLADLDAPESSERAALRQVWQIVSQALPSDYTDDSYLMTDVG